MASDYADARKAMDAMNHFISHYETDDDTSIKDAMISAFLTGWHEALKSKG